MDYVKLKNWNSGMVKGIIRRHPMNPHEQNGFISGAIVGERGGGKSTYAYKVLAKTYYELNGYNTIDAEEEAYKEALDCIIFDPLSFIQLIMRNKRNRTITPAICLDDASVHFGKYLFQTNAKLNQAILGLTATLRTAVTGFLITCPTRAHLAKFLREYDDYRVRIIRQNDRWERIARYYQWNYYPDEKKYRVQVPFQDKYSCYIPEPYYTWYYNKKMAAELSHAEKSIEFCKDMI